MSSHDPDQLALPGGRVAPADAVTLRATTSGGPGGQHVNRTCTRVEARVTIGLLPLSAAERQLVERRLSGRINAAGELVAWAGERRSQLQNRRRELRRVEQLLAEAMHREPPRIPTRISAGAKRRRLDAKRAQADRKKQRRWRSDE